MRRIKFFAGMTAIALALSACTEIDYGAPPSEIVTQTTTTAAAEPPIDDEMPTSLDRYNAAEYGVNSEEVNQKMQLEGNCDCTTYSVLMGYEGDGYIQLPDGLDTSIVMNVPSSQFYDITLRVCSVGTTIELYGGTGELYGVYEIVDSQAFTDFELKSVYLEKGSNTFLISITSGLAFMDSISIANSAGISENAYRVNITPLDDNALPLTVSTFQYLSDIYGQQTLTAQYVTTNTNAEIGAIYQQTGRLPAIRCADLAAFQPESSTYSDSNLDLDLAAEWAREGGLVSYSWTWYTAGDDSHYLSSVTGFNFANITNTNIAELSFETIETMYGNGEISYESYKLIEQLDRMAEVLKTLQDNGVTVLFRPLMDPGAGIYWWGTDADAYQWLWKTMVDRFNNYLGLHNIIWVWTGPGAEFYPGDDYVDIIAGTSASVTDSSSAQLFSTLLSYCTGVKMQALAESVHLQNPDLLARDNTRWLWTSLWRGDYLIDSNGRLTEQYTTNRELDYAYNNSLFVTFDELPSLAEYASNVQ